ncbi:sulfur carrier protein ThiS [Sulfoacidibacillus thermotolerans]|uniref:Thiamine biosynthesis protein ThiS n=1 Tax=Sulfoacidibacillus thermotolerans TaxID=1765684 RepID=A0A2U3D6J5_SULT2|nr:sulfur carrier protein ThiS [Sulfoacidibacillus thermotolerans]PWI56908.1 thiamine biosynthesis protein ThiS [Sulfoacidibacillus thermotolerans]
MDILVNGQRKSVPDTTTIFSLLEQFHLQDELIAVEHNGEIIAREAYATRRLTEKDVIEIVRFVGGG